jgi:hypothetical protein
MPHAASRVAIVIPRPEPGSDIDYRTGRAPYDESEPVKDKAKQAPSLKMTSICKHWVARSSEHSDPPSVKFSDIFSGKTAHPWN